MTLQFTKDRFLKKTVIVTGAGAGIGRACVQRLANEGARVIATDISAPRLEDLKKQLSSFDVVTVVGDISLEETTQAIMTQTHGKVDALVNNAGIMDGFLPAAEVDDATWEKVFAVNVTSVMRLTRAVLPLMLQAQKGSIVNISSEAGLRGACAGVAYTSSKHAVIGFTKNTAFMYAAKGIRTNAVTPGAVNTSIEAPFKSKFAEEKLGPIFQALIKSSAESEHLAACITWLCSDDSPNINGAVIASDGGWSAI
ncbi:MAG: SDR family NAD(P)-dependent oxidoreductase [Pseudobdellovibrio sp.]